MANLTSYGIMSAVTHGLLALICLVILPISTSGSPSPIALQTASFENIENSDALRIVYAFAIIFILIVIAYLTRKYIRVPGERSDLLHIPDLAPEVKVWDDTNVESLISLHGETVPVFSSNQRTQNRDRWPGLIPAILHYLGFRDNGRNLSVHRRYLLETLQNEAKARISLRELAMTHKKVEQEAINDQLRLENERMKLFWERRRIEMENRWRLKFFSSASESHPNGKLLSSENIAGIGSDVQNYLHRKQSPRVRCLFKALFEDHSESVESISFSPDGKFLASGGWDKFVRIWDLQTEMPVRAFETNSKVYSVAFAPKSSSSPNGLLVAGTESGIIELWKNEPSGWLRQPDLVDHTEVVESLAFSSSGRWLASGGWDKKVCLWTVTPQNPQPISSESQLEMTGYKDAIAQVAFSFDDNRQDILALVGWDKTLEIFSLRETLQSGTSPERIQMSNPLEKVSTIAFSPNGEMFAAASPDGVVRIWQTGITPWQDRAIQIVHEDEVASLSFSPNGQLLALGLLDGTMKLLNIENVRHPLSIATVRRHSAAITCVAFSPNGKTLATASRDHTINLWDVKVLFPYSPSTF